MTQIRRQVDTIIVRLKRMQALEGVRFIREYGNSSIETPVRGLLAVVGVTQTTCERGYIGGYLSSSVRGETYGAKVDIRLYAPARENGSGLSEMVIALVEGLKNADEEHLITNVHASSIEFDAEMNAIYRTVAFDMEFCLCEEG